MPPNCAYRRNKEARLSAAVACVIKIWLPNLVTIVRLPLAGATVYCILDDELTAALWLLVVSGLTDALDGFLARWLDARTPLGSYLDPIADKVLLVSVFLALGTIGLLPTWLVVLVVGRDIFIIVGAGILYAAERTVHTVSPTYASKVNTAMQIALAAAVLSIHGFDLHPEPTTTILVSCVAITTVASGTGYAVQLVRRLRALHLHRGEG